MSDQTYSGVDQDTPPEPMPTGQAEQPIFAPTALDPRMTGGETAIQSPSAAFATPQNPVLGPEVDVDPNEALTEAQAQDAPVATPAAQEETKQPTDDEILDAIVPKTEPKAWIIGPQDMQMQFVQRRMSFIGKMQWFALLGGVLDKAMQGPSGISLNEVMAAPTGRNGQLALADFQDADTFVRAAGKLVSHAPDFITESYCIWLGVPEHQRKIVSEIMALPAEEGGLTDEQGIEIIEVFIDQNYDALADFFSGKLGALQSRVRARSKARTDRRRG